MIQFKKVILHNFGSYSHAELDLQNRGFCLVSGQNNYAKDNALSNGSGKTFLLSAICYALTGETVNGVKSNLKNINIDEPDCWVQLEFTYQKDFYNICRIVAPKSDLRIFRNDIDVSGKGIRESEKKLQDLLPELNKDFIASTLLLGQGMPNKFSSFSPSGRKDLLEKLTKSDFMIEDIKMRLAGRQQELNLKVREFEDSLLANKTQLNNCISQLNKLKANIENQVRPDFDQLISQQSKKLTQAEEQKAQCDVLITNTENKIEILNQRLLVLTSEKAKVSTEELSAYNASHSVITTNKTRIEFDISSTKKEIKKLQSIVDVCPTCGQHIPNVHKPDTSSLETELHEYNNALTKVVEELTQCETKHQEYLKQIDSAYKDELDVLNKELTDEKTILHEARLKQANYISIIDAEKNCYNKLVYDKQNWDSYIQRQQDEIMTLETEITRFTNIISITSLAKEDFDQRLAIIKKMDQLTKRDFRGYLLINIISYIDQKAKKYCETVFGTRELTLEINGNALDITYCGKCFDGLSGGEKQRVDLILQLAIRDLLNSYLNLSANILVLDEITDFLDKKSCGAVMQLLEKELNTIESVFIISHHASDLGISADSELHVIKNENGISELY
jgi:DNA repair exonuclease SbcCD ATPase subunit